MIERKPAYYSAFSCLAGACPDSCCHEWEVEIDPATAAFYLSLPDALGNRLRRVLRTEEGVIYLTIQDGRCPMWRADGLCEIQCQHGHDALSETCRSFPRLCHDYGNFLERGLELSCPAAAELILHAPEQPLVESTLPGGEAGDYDADAMALLQRARKALLEFWEKRPYPLPEMLAVTLLYAHETQSALDGGKEIPFAPGALRTRAFSLAKEGTIDGIFGVFRELEILTDRWRTLLSTPLSHPQWHSELPNFVRYGILRYFFQAVSDYDLLCRMKWLIIACLLLSYLPGDFVQNAQLFSKEIENNSENMDALWDAAYTCPAFADFGIWGLLLEK